MSNGWSGSVTRSLSGDASRDAIRNKVRRDTNMDNMETERRQKLAKVLAEIAALENAPSPQGLVGPGITVEARLRELRAELPKDLITTAPVTPANLAEALLVIADLRAQLSALEKAVGVQE
jgi:hypothetical protein